MTATACPIDGRPVDPDLDHAGRPHGGERRIYCDPDCRAEARNRRRNEAARLARRDAARKAELARRADLDAASPPLPGMPAPPPVEELYP